MAASPIRAQGTLIRASAIGSYTSETALMENVTGGFCGVAQRTVFENTGGCLHVAGKRSTLRDAESFPKGLEIKNTHHGLFLHLCS